MALLTFKNIQQMALQVQKAELEQMYSSENQEKAQALNDMYNSAKGGAMYY
jgi:hypothetical protein